MQLLARAYNETRRVADTRMSELNARLDLTWTFNGSVGASSRAGSKRKEDT